MDSLFKSVQFLKGVGPQRTRLLQKLGINTVFDLLWYVPRAYFNRSKLTAIADLAAGQQASVRGSVLSVQNYRSRRGMSIFKALLDDGSGIISAVWFNQPYLAGQIKPGQDVFITGRLKDNYDFKEITVSEYEVIDAEDSNLKVVPVYTLTEGLNQKFLRTLTASVLDNYLPYYPDILTAEIKNRCQLCDIRQALRSIHFPENGESYLAARKRLAFEELFLFRLQLVKNKAGMVSQPGIKHIEKTALRQQISDNLPFQLTGAQHKVLEEIYRDMESDRAMNRLLQGDVGSGKTVVAALAMAKAAASGYQAAIMAPTEILADQHYSFLNRFFAPAGLTIASLTGSTPAAERRLIVQALEEGEINILAGTHALIQDDVQFKALGLVVIDEQHRFGVRQRALLSRKGLMPDVLVMTATPIPRTLALTMYGDLDISVIDELPPGRKPVKTVYVGQYARSRAYEFVRQKVKQGAQAYIVCPLVEESEKQDLQAVVSLFEELSQKYYPDIKVGLLHGRMKAGEKDYVMQGFKSSQIQVLVTTTVIEVGVDVANATIMLVEHADRFGLSQLHQLRGRVGRGSQQSYCILTGEAKTEEALRRLRAMEKTNDGFELANEDLAIRGPGDFWGVRQHGLGNLKVANLLKDQKIIEMVSRAFDSINELNVDERTMASYMENKFPEMDRIARN